MSWPVDALLNVFILIHNTAMKKKTNVYLSLTECPIVETTVSPAVPVSRQLDENSLFPAGKDITMTQRHIGEKFPYTGLVTLNKEYRPWN